MEKEICKVMCVKNEKKEIAILELTECEDCVSIEFELGEKSLKKEGDTYFETLIELRRELEKNNIKLLCKGCCKNVYPSPMILSMGVGRSAYILTLGQQAKKDSLVDIFDQCLLEEYATVEEQLQFYNMWIYSLRK